MLTSIFSDIPSSAWINTLAGLTVTGECVTRVPHVDIRCAHIVSGNKSVSIELSVQQDNEPCLVPARVHAMDGNFSLKCVDSAGHTDERKFESSYQISPAQVDIFKDEVNHHSVNRSESSLPNTNHCTDNWTAAKTTPEDTVKIFEQTGIFVSACRHGIIETFAEMRRSGEL
jgi:hypothetical protein